MEKCKPKFHTFGDCAKANGIMVVFKCRAENQAISDCLDMHGNESSFRQYMSSKGFQWQDLPEKFPMPSSNNGNNGVFIRNEIEKS